MDGAEELVPDFVRLLSPPPRRRKPARVAETSNDRADAIAQNSRRHPVPDIFWRWPSASDVPHLEDREMPWGSDPELDGLLEKYRKAKTRYRPWPPDIRAAEAEVHRRCRELIRIDPKRYGCFSVPGYIERVVFRLALSRHTPYGEPQA